MDGPLDRVIEVSTYYRVISISYIVHVHFI